MTDQDRIKRAAEHMSEDGAQWMRDSIAQIKRNMGDSPSRFLVWTLAEQEAILAAYDNLHGDDEEDDASS